MDKEVVFTQKQVKIPKKQIEEMLAASWKGRDEEIEKGLARILRKTELKDRFSACIEIRERTKEGDYTWWMPHLMGLVKISIDKERKTMTGIRVMRHCSQYEAYEMTFNLDNYRKNWRAWTYMV